MILWSEAFWSFSVSHLISGLKQLPFRTVWISTVKLHRVHEVRSPNRLAWSLAWFWRRSAAAKRLFFKRLAFRNCHLPNWWALWWWRTFLNIRPLKAILQVLKARTSSDLTRLTESSAGLAHESSVSATSVSLWKKVSKVFCTSKLGRQFLSPQTTTRSRSPRTI